MNISGSARRIFILWFSLGALLFLTRIYSFSSELDRLRKFLPQVDGWKLESKPEFYEPARLFEYINGASEAYLAYDFQGLLVAQYNQEKSGQPLLTVEIYDMGQAENAFGIYSAERPSEAGFLEIGTEGYLEEGALQFFVGHYYVKILCFLEGEEADKVSRLFGQELRRLIPEKGEWPAILTLFPPAGLMPHTQKFIKKNFLGFDYLHDGYTAAYKREGLSFEAFIIQANNPGEAEAMEKRIVKDLSGDEAEVKEHPWGKLMKTKYFQYVCLKRKGPFLFGLMRMSEEKEKIAMAFMLDLEASITKINLEFKQL